MALLRYIDVRVIRQDWLNRRVLEILTFELVTTGNEIVLTGPNIETRIEGMDAPVEIRPRRPSKRLEVDSQRSIDAAAIGGQALIAERVAEGLGRPLGKENCAGKEI